MEQHNTNKQETVSVNNSTSLTDLLDESSLPTGIMKTIVKNKVKKQIYKIEENSSNYDKLASQYQEMQKEIAKIDVQEDLKQSWIAIKKNLPDPKPQVIDDIVIVEKERIEYANKLYNNCNLAEPLILKYMPSIELPSKLGDRISTVKSALTTIYNALDK